MSLQIPLNRLKSGRSFKDLLGFGKHFCAKADFLLNIKKLGVYYNGIFKRKHFQRINLISQKEGNMELKTGFISKQPYKPQQENNKTLSDCALFLLQTGQYAQAYAILKELLDKEKTVPSLFNMSLCLLAADKPEDAAVCLEEAVLLCRKDMLSLTETADPVIRILEAAEEISDAYKAPMAYISSAKCARAAKIKTVRLLADAYLQSKNRQKLNEIISNPEYIKYKNVKEAKEASENNFKG